jgi:uncharacterized repeat protein (TIGR01451 family)
VIVAAVLVLLAAPKFDTSTISASRSTIHPLETIDYTITIRNSGDSAASYLRVANAIPTSAMFANASKDWKFIESERELSWMGTLRPGTSKVLTLSLITRPESAGWTLANRVAIHSDGSYWALDHDLQIDTPPTANGLTPAGGFVIGYLALAIATVIVLRRSRTAAMLVVVSIGFLLIFGHLAWRDSRKRSHFAETQCTVLDSMTRYDESQNASSTRTRPGSRTPLFALRYPTPAGDTISIGSASASQLPRGEKAPCWYDPDDPKQVVLTRSFGGEYGFALIPLAALTLGIALLRKQPRLTS